MPPAKPASFGRRGVGAPVGGSAGSSLRRPAAAEALTTTESGVPLDQLARQLLGERSHSSAQDAATRGPGVVPWSWRAAMLAGLAAACLRAGLIVLSAQTAAPILPGLPIAVGGEGSAMAPALIAWGLWSGGRDAATTMFIANLILRLLKTDSPVAYALGGALVGAGSSYATMLLLGGENDIAVQAALGLAAGFLYRIFAGTKPA